VNSFPDGTETMIFRGVLDADGDPVILPATEDCIDEGDPCPCEMKTGDGLCDECQAKW
jgi:hypothetical protein